MGRSRRPVFVAIAVAASVVFIVSVAVVLLATLTADGCVDATDVAYPQGSCLPVFTAASVSRGDLRLSVATVARPGGSVQLAVTYRNTTTAPRSLDWRKLTAVSPTGKRVGCWGDDSAYRYEALPGEEKDLYGGCELEAVEDGQYRVFYDGIEAAAAYL